MQLFRDPAETQQAALQARRRGQRIGLVPTMGNLHAGHRALMRRARGECDLLIVSIFVNPTQFGPNEDYERYPRTLDSDLEACRAERVDWVFAPDARDMYSEGAKAFVEIEDWGAKLCGKSRPTHFRGVTTVVAKLFNLCLPDLAVFGWKDAQQFLILRRMAESLCFPVKMVGEETVREADGLALSSRNQYLSAEERAQAPALSQALRAAKDAARAGQAKTGADLVRIARSWIEDRTQAKIDYIEAVSMATLEPILDIEPDNTLLALAAWFGQTRLIDNVRL